MTDESKSRIDSYEWDIISDLGQWAIVRNKLYNHPRVACKFALFHECDKDDPHLHTRTDAGTIIGPTGCSTPIPPEVKFHWDLQSKLGGKR